MEIVRLQQEVFTRLESLFQIARPLNPQQAWLEKPLSDLLLESQKLHELLLVLNYLQKQTPAEPAARVAAQPLTTVQPTAVSPKVEEPKPEFISDIPETAKPEETIVAETEQPELEELSETLNPELDAIVKEAARRDQPVIAEKDHTHVVMPERPTPTPEPESIITPQTKAPETTPQSKPLYDLSAVIGINDRFLFIRELFKGNTGQFNDALERLNAAQSRLQSNQLLKAMRDERNWAEDSEGYQRLLEFVQRRFQ